MSPASRLRPAKATPLVTLAAVDYAGLMRGRSITCSEYEAAKGEKTCGWVPANMSLTTFDLIADPNPWGSVGDLRLLPDKKARYTSWAAKAATPLDLVMSDIVELDGSPWVCCPRSFLKTALADFKKETGCELLSSFEQEFQIMGADWVAAPSFAVSALRRADPFGPELMAMLEQAGIVPEVFTAEYGNDQYEIISAPSAGVVPADRAAVIREIVRELARLYGWRASFSPKTTVDGVGNGVHVHFSFSGGAAYDKTKSGHLSELAGSFCAGVLRHMPALIAFTAASPISGLRFKPHNWSSSYTWLGERDREASLRICPVVAFGTRSPATQFNIEYRAADATASPHIVLGAIVRAGLEGIRNGLPPPPIFSGDPEKLSAAEREKQELRRLPQSLGEAIDCLKRDATACGWFTEAALETYIGMKRMEMKLCEGLEGEALCQRYAGIY